MNILDRHMQLLINVNNNMAASKSQDITISLQTLSPTSHELHIYLT